MARAGVGITPAFLIGLFPALNNAVYTALHAFDGIPGSAQYGSLRGASLPQADGEQADYGDDRDPQSSATPGVSEAS